jgi:chitin disaccharide deacetylase
VTGESRNGRHGADEHSGSRALCIVVDDYGLHEGICQAALHLIEMHRVHAIGCMVGAPAWHPWAPSLRATDPRSVDVGLHLDLTEHPLRRQARGIARVIACSLLHTLDRNSVRREIVAQLDAFEAAMGRTPAFVDGHQHVHQFPVVREELLSELHRRYAPALPWLRRTRGGDAPDLKARTIELLGARGLATMARQMGFRQNTHLLGVYDFKADEGLYLNLLNKWLRMGADGDLLMCHPSCSPHEGEGDPIGSARSMEHRILSGNRFGELLREHCVSLKPMTQILETSAFREASRHG